MREFDQDVHCIAVRSPQADVEISPERKVALADLLSNCLDLEYKVSAIISSASAGLVTNVRAIFEDEGYCGER